MTTGYEQDQYQMQAPIVAAPVDESQLAGRFGDIMSIRIHNPPELSITKHTKVKASGLNPAYVSYHIEGTTHYGKLEISRRFSEFVKFRGVLY
jgi:hypothetical protein